MLIRSYQSLLTRCLSMQAQLENISSNITSQQKSPYITLHTLQSQQKSISHYKFPLLLGFAHFQIIDISQITMDLETLNANVSQLDIANVQFKPVELEQKRCFNKDSVNTNVGEDIQTQINVHMYEQNPSVQGLQSKKTKFIYKKQYKLPAPILKHKKVLQTLRNITKNIKSQINTKNSSQNNHFNPKINRLQTKKQPEINSITQNSQKIQEERPITNYQQDKKLRIISDGIKQNLPLPLHEEEIVAGSPTKACGPMAKQSIMLYSKYKNKMQCFPVFEDRLLTDKKQFRNLTIQRLMDNDVDSEDEQIQMSIGYMYCELMNSCQKNTEMRRQQEKLIKASQMKSKGKVINHQMPLEKVKQKLNFN